MERRRSSVSSATSEKRSNATIISISAAGESSTDHPDSNNSAPIGRRCICIPINMNFVMIPFLFLVLTPQILYQIINNIFLLKIVQYLLSQLSSRQLNHCPNKLQRQLPRLLIKSALNQPQSAKARQVKQSFIFFPYFLLYFIPNHCPSEAMLNFYDILPTFQSNALVLNCLYYHDN